MTEIVFVVEAAPEGGFTARALGASIFTEADTEVGLLAAVQDAVRCHFDEEHMPKVIRLHFVRDELYLSRSGFRFSFSQTPYASREKPAAHQFAWVRFKVMRPLDLAPSPQRGEHTRVWERGGRGQCFILPVILKMQKLRCETLLQAFVTSFWPQIRYQISL